MSIVVVVPDRDRDLFNRPCFRKPHSAWNLVDRIDKLVVHRVTQGTSHPLDPKR